MSHFDEAPPDEVAKTDPHASPAPLDLPVLMFPAGGIVRDPEEAFVLYSSEVAAGQRASVAFGMLLIELAELVPSNEEAFRELVSAEPMNDEVMRARKLIESMPSLTVLFRSLAAGFDHAIGFSDALPADAVAPAHRCFRAVLLGLVDVVARLESDVI